MDLPRYRDLPADGPLEHVSWGVFGPGDQVGAFNLQTPARVLAAARLIRKGAVFPLNWPLELPDPAIFSRNMVQHHVVRFEGGVGHDDWYDSFYPQQSSQWDALSHMGTGDQRFYGGFGLDEVGQGAGSKLGIEHWARRGIAGRAVLLDFPRWWAATQPEPFPAGQTVRIGVDYLEAMCQFHGVRPGPGDVLLVRSGFTAWYMAQPPEVRALVGARGGPGWAAMLADESVAEWLWDHGVCAAAGDNPSFEAIGPSKPGVSRVSLHFLLIGRLGIAIGEMFDLERLAEDCAADGVYEAFFTSAPLNKAGGVGSPPNALAIK